MATSQHQKKQEALALATAGHKPADISRALRVHRATVHKWLAAAGLTGTRPANDAAAPKAAANDNAALHARIRELETDNATLIRALAIVSRGGR